MSRPYKSYFRPEIDAMQGYTPGEQPKMQQLIKLNTNENPYPPSENVLQALKDLDMKRLRLYPDPLADDLCDLIARHWGISRNMVIAANGSDDLLTMVFRAFTSDKLAVSFLEPTYSLYKILAQMQHAEIRKIKLTGDNFEMPSDILEQAKGTNLLIITRPNAPTGNSFAIAKMREICEKFDGIVLIDEAYADFAEDNCIDFVKEYPNVIVSRTFSKSYSLAGMRLGYAVGNEELINGLYKLKDSYNVDLVAQTAAKAAFADQENLVKNCKKIKETRAMLYQALRDMNFTIVPSETNFLFASPPDGDGERYFKALRDEAIIVRYFPGEITGRYVRITIGLPEEMEKLLKVTKNLI
ncbi:MAG: histidinol-phosphate transaminase [Lentisphaeria bacterium]|nr:histidinol-phosphate transaminase [Lentisphaeria bacterium]